MKYKKVNYKNWIKLLLIATVGALIGRSTEFPIGAMLGALVIVAFTQVKYMFVSQVPTNGRRVIQVLIGSSLGLAFTSDTLNAINEMWLIAIIVPLCHIVLALFMSFIIYRFLKIDLITVLCSMAPAGIAEMIITSEKYNAHLPTVVTIHVYRVVVIVTLIPPLILY